MAGKHTYSHRQWPQTKPDRRSAAVELRQKGVIGTPLTWRQPPSSVVFEACGGPSFWAREMHMLGHEVRLIAPQYVKPFVKPQKNDATDAEAIVVAARQPEMRFVSPKSEEQQARAATELCTNYTVGGGHTVGIDIGSTIPIFNIFHELWEAF